MPEEPKEKKLIIDEDWKNKAQQDKEQPQDIQPEQEAPKEERPELPEANLTGLISMLATQAFYALGLIRSKDDKNEAIEPDWAMAKYHIDLLTVLEQKCKGNLDKDEAATLKNTLDHLRMAFVELSKQ
jgi:hypothetical protein